MKKIIIALIFLLSYLNVYADVGLLLDKCRSAREKSLKYGSVANGDIISGIYSNPAVIGNINSISGTISYMSYISSINIFYGDVVFPVKNINVNGRFGYAGMETMTDIVTGDSLEFRELYFGLGSGYKLPYNIIVGANANFFSAKYATYSAATVLFNIGVNYKLSLYTISDNTLSFGISVLNLGPGIKFIEETEPLPTTFKIGTMLNHNNKFKVLVGIEKKSQYSGYLYSCGIDLNVIKIVNFRASLYKDIDNTTKFNVGFGSNIIIDKFLLTFDLSYIPMIVNNTLTVSLSFRSSYKEENVKESIWKNKF